VTVTPTLRMTCVYGCASECEDCDASPTERDWLPGLMQGFGREMHYSCAHRNSALPRWNAALDPANRPTRLPYRPRYR